MIGPAQFLIGREINSGKRDQRRRGKFDRKDVESPGEEPRLEIRNAIRAGASEIDGGFRIAESH